MNSCPQGFNTPYILGREGCVECLTKVCLVPAVSNEIGEWFPYFLDELESIKIEHMKLVRTTMLECYHAIGERINKEFKDKKKADTYGEKIMHEASKRLKISESYLYEMRAFSAMYPDLLKCPVDTWNSARKLVKAEGDMKGLLEECKHENTVMVKWCNECHRRVE